MIAVPVSWHMGSTAGGDIGVFQEVVGDETVIVGRFGVFENIGELLQMAGAQQMVDVGKSRFRKQAQPFGVDGQNFLSLERVDGDIIGSQLAVWGVVFAQWEKIGGACFCHHGTSLACLSHRLETGPVSGLHDMLVETPKVCSGVWSAGLLARCGRLPLRHFVHFRLCCAIYRNVPSNNCDMRDSLNLFGKH